MKRRSVFVLLCLLLVLPTLAFSQAKVTLELLIHQNAPLVDYINCIQPEVPGQVPEYHGERLGGEGRRACHLHPDAPDGE